VIAPATERARFIAPAHAAKVPHEASPAARPSATVKREGSQAHEKARAAPERRAQREKAMLARENGSSQAQTRNVPHEQAAPARERHEPPAPRVEAVRPPNRPDAAPQQGGKDHEPKNEHGREKAR